MRSQELDQRDLANMALPLHRSVVARNSGSFSFKERWVTRLAGPVINASHETNRSNRVAQGCALDRQALLTIALYRVTRKTNMDENGRMRHDECD